MSKLTAKLEGKTLVIRIPVDDPPQPSRTGKTLVIASTRGNATTDCKIDGKPLVIGLNAYVK